MISKKCRLCESKKLFKFLDLGHHPPSDQFNKGEDLNQSAIYYPLEVYSCLKCGFKQLGYVVDPKILYQRNYPYESSLTSEGQKHYEEFAKSVVKEYGLSKNDLSIDIGSNVGVLLKAFRKNDLRILGIEPAQNICKIANNKGIPTINKFFDNIEYNSRLFFLNEVILHQFLLCDS